MPSELSILNIRMAISADLRLINTGNGYPLTIAAVYDEPIDEGRAMYPNAQVKTDEGGTSETETLGRGMALANQAYTIKLSQTGTKVYQDLDNLLESVLNALGNHDSSVMSLPRVEDVLFEWTGADRSESETGIVHFQTVTVTVTFDHTIGEA